MSWSTITLQKDDSIRSYAHDLKTGDYYIPDSSSLLRVKCVAICAFIPIYTAIYMGYHVYTIIKGDIRKSLTNVIRSAMYGISVTFAAAAGLIDPLQGRKLEAIIENQWQEGLSRHQDAGLRHRASGQKAYYLAVCFQPKGNIRDRGTTLLSGPVPARC